MLVADYAKLDAVYRASVSYCRNVTPANFRKLKRAVDAAAAQDIRELNKVLEAAIEVVYDKDHNGSVRLLAHRINAINRR
jgi:hypothetical protein